ncbi:MAG: hypothetical protein IMY84_06140, partial [Chloroflexi bacterium]|nr:hypothetical protein [Chloroflexota bacterium]
MNRDDRIDEKREERRDDEPGQETAEAIDQGQEGSLADAEAVDRPETGDVAAATQAESKGTGAEEQSEPVGQKEEETPADEPPFD